MTEIIFFGYGALKDPYIIKEILGKEPKGGEGVVLNGFNLAIQALSQIPEKPREILKKVWGENFRAYTIVEGQGIVEGRNWLIDEEDLEKIKKWEFIDQNGWRELINVSVTNSKGKIINAVTEKTLEKQKIVEVVDGLNYATSLNKEGKKYYSKEDENEIALMREEIKKYYESAAFA